ncbi:Protein JASON [Linum grandiflorum]
MTRVSSFKCDVGFICRSLLGFLDLSVSSAMACLFNCFRVRADDSFRSRRHPQLVSPAPPTEAGESKNRSSKLFVSDEEKDYPATCDNKGNLSWSSPGTQRELRDEASFLKACGTLLETPGELREASEKLKSPPLADDGSAHSKFHSWMPNSCSKKLLADMEADEHSTTPMKSFEESRRDSISSDQAPNSCISHAQNSGNISMCSTEDSERRNMKAAVKLEEEDIDDASSATPFVTATKSQLRNKSVHFQSDFGTSSSEGTASGSSGQDLKNSDRFGDFSISKLSTRPTPLKISGEMQTPGTVFPVNVDSSGYGKTKVRSQYVCSVLHPIENASQWKELKEDRAESLQQSEDTTPYREASIGRTSPSANLKLEASLSAWLKSVSETNQNVNGKTDHVGKTPGDRPIIGMVAAHWNNDDPIEVPPKWWDGNGIPNTTTKYKEDQKVSWHATPFEERLEKALSEEGLVTQKKPVISGKPIAFDECEEESDIAISAAAATSSHHSKSVVSY